MEMPAESRLMDAAHVQCVREELTDVLRAGIDDPGFAGVDGIDAYLRSGRVDEAREALERLKQGGL